MLIFYTTLYTKLTYNRVIYRYNVIHTCMHAGLSKLNFTALFPENNVTINTKRLTTDY